MSDKLDRFVMETILAIEAHRGHVILSPGVGKERQDYAAGILDDLEGEIRALARQAGVKVTEPS